MATKKKPEPTHHVAQAIRNVASQIFRERMTFLVCGLEVMANPDKKTALVIRRVGQ